MDKIKLNAVMLNYFCTITKINVNSKYVCNVYDDMKKKIIKKNTNYRMRRGLEKAENNDFHQTSIGFI